MSDYEGRECACEGCSKIEACAQHRQGPWLCYDCWHAAREKEEPFNVVWQVDGMICNTDGVYLKEEADDFARELNERNKTTRYYAHPAHSWVGERMAHPGYMQRRRRAIFAKHPELKTDPHFGFTPGKDG